MLKFAIILAVVAVCHVNAENTYLLYTKDNVNRPQSIDYKEYGLTIPDSLNFDGTLKTIILVHGHNGAAFDRFNKLNVEAILNNVDDEDFNVIVVDWEREASYSYSVSSSHVPDVGKELTEFLEWLISVADAEPEDIHLVGFGLGAHAVGIAARKVDDIARITGLDPSGSGWGSNPERLHRNDAKYVEVIHTDGSGLFANGIGAEIGDINFYANGGSNQPGCLSNSCSHERAFELFAASMIHSNLQGFPCDSKTQLNLNRCRGNPVPLGKTMLSKVGARIYRVNTGRRYPFY